MNIAIVGFSVEETSEALAAYRYYTAQGAQITAFYWGEEDIASRLPEGINKVNIENNQVVEIGPEYDLVVRSPAVHPKYIKSSAPVTSVTKLFFELSPAPIIGITGTKGKGTTSSLITKLIESTGKKVHLCGNIGKPALDILANVTADDVVIYEISSFQLIDMDKSPKIAACLMVVSEHQDWHTDLDEYLTAKRKIFSGQHAGDVAVFNKTDAGSRDIASSIQAGVEQRAYDTSGTPDVATFCGLVGTHIVAGGENVADVSDLAIVGRHNVQNACAAIAAAWDYVKDHKEKIPEVLRSFSGLEHRLELVNSVDNVKYYDDSFGTTPETAIVALEAFQAPKVIILGGSDKGAAYEDLAKAVVGNNVRAVVVVGDTAGKITEALQTAGYSNINAGGATMTEMVNIAKSKAMPGDVVLLSTACASFGLFKNYKDRGEQFKSAVLKLTSVA